MDLRDKGQENSTWFEPKNSAKVKKIRYIRNKRLLQVIYKKSPFVVSSWANIPYSVYSLSGRVVSLDVFLRTRINNRFKGFSTNITQMI
jgi:hypothetical protein